jgi:ABC-type phosphate/phosphonate transport system substrate-binding protein
VAGTAGNLYSSRIIVNADSDIKSLADCRNRVAAMNNSDSNSGMNVLRHAVAEIHTDGPFFSRVITSGGHLHSLEAVARGDADVAAIDCVSFQLIADWQPQLVARVRVIADTVKTSGLPMVMLHADLADTDTDALVRHFNQALASMADEVGAILHLTGFTKITLDDYQNVVDAERYAIERAYPELI